MSKPFMIKDDPIEWDFIVKFRVVQVWNRLLKTNIDSIMWTFHINALLVHLMLHFRYLYTILI